MCACSQPNINGQPGYVPTYNVREFVRPVDPPAIESDVIVLYDEPGRCIDIAGYKADNHAFHFAIAKKLNRLWLYVKYGADTECIMVPRTSNEWMQQPLEAMGTTYRFLLCKMIYDVHKYTENETAARYVSQYNREMEALRARR